MSIVEKLISLKCQFMSMYMPVLRTKQIYKSNFGKKPNLKNPVSINEKLQYLKLNTYYNNPVITNCIDKYMIREYLIKKGFSELLPELYGVYGSADEIPFAELPESFVIKCNHGCGFNIICPDKSKLDIENSKNLLRTWMKQDYWKKYAEVQYKFIKKRIIIEQFLGYDIFTFKFYCFHGVPKVMYVSTRDENREKEYYDYFDMQWNHLNVSLAGHPNRPDYQCIEKPENFEEMKKTAKALSEDFPFVRVDLYNINGRIYISELTFIPTGGFMRLTPEGTAEKWGNWL